MKVWGAFFRAQHAHRQLMARKFSERGLHHGQAACLREIGHHDGITQRDLAAAVHVTRPAITVMLQKLEKAGLVERRVDEKDQRFTRIYLTDAGMAKHLEMHELIGELLDATVGQLSEADQLELARLLGVLTEKSLEALGEAPLETGVPVLEDGIE